MTFGNSLKKYHLRLPIHIIKEGIQSSRLNAHYYSIFFSPLPSIQLEPVMLPDIPNRRPQALFPFLIMVGLISSMAVE